MFRAVRVGALFLFSTAAAFAPHSAYACSVGCEVPGVVLPLDGESAPANAVFPFFGFRQSLAGATLTGAADVGAELGHDSRFGFIRPAMPTPGRYQLMFLSNCADGTQRGGYQSFEIQGEAPLPTSLGVLRVSAPDVTEVALDAGGPCSANAVAVGSQVWVELDATAVPWQGVLV